MAHFTFRFCVVSVVVSGNAQAHISFRMAKEKHLSAEDHYEQPQTSQGDDFGQDVSTHSSPSSAPYLFVDRLRQQKLSSERFRNAESDGRSLLKMKLHIAEEQAFGSRGRDFLPGNEQSGER